MTVMKIYPAAYALSALLLFFFMEAHALTAIAQTTVPPTSPPRNVARALATHVRAKRIAPLRSADTPDGTRVAITSDAPLSDYSAYRRGDDFCVRIPRAESAESDTARHAVGGRGLVATLIEQVEGDLLLTFRLEAGTTARAEQNFNRLDIIFTSAKPSQSEQADERLRQVLKRVEELEARVKELEAKQSSAAAKQNESPAPSDARAAVNAPSTATTQAKEESSAHGGMDDDGHASGDHPESLPTGTPRMQIQGYADVNLRASSEKGRTTSFSLGQFDLFITSRLSENLSVLGELILEAEEDNSFTFSTHRLLLRYAPRDYFALSIGRDHTSIGYYNTAYHHGSWFATAATRPYLFAFENKGGILPLHNVGVSVSGRIPSAPFGLRYVAEIGNGRSFNSPTDRSVATAVDENNGKAFNLALLARPPRLPGFQAGFSVYRDRRTPEGAAAVGETIMAAHLVRRTSRSELLNEGVLIRHASGARVFYTPGFYTQFARRFGDARPYFRYQYVNAPDDDPVFRPLEVGRRNGPSLGLRYDVSEFAAFKMQFDRTFRRHKNAHDELILQLAFTF
jgi:BMFP domain-containing protein YqiC